MSNDELLTDDYVAGLLAQDAQDCSLKYSAMGMEAFRDNKKPVNLPKPNTRFLRHVIKSTDSHNKALLAKEAADSRARLKKLDYATEVKRKKTNPNERDIRTRHMGDIHAILAGKKKKRHDGSGEDDDGHRRRGKDRERDSQGRAKSAKDDDLFEHGSGKRRHGRLSERDGHHGDDASGRKDKKQSRRNRDHGSSAEEESHSQRRRSSRDRSRSPRRHRSRSPDERRRRHRHRHRSHHRSRSRDVVPRQKKDASPPADQDSDPLEDLMGPAPPPARPRGRGTIGGAAALGRRFSDSYDPALDLQMGSEEDTWDDAVESFRDRQRLRINQDQRLREAGFTDEQIQRSKSTAKEADQHVVWSKAGEKREWDKGKELETGGNDGAHPSTLFSEDH